MLKRNGWMWVLAVIILFLAPGLNADSSKDEVPLIPMKDFFKNPVKASYQLSPDGEHLAFLQSWKNRLNVHVQKIGEYKVTRITSAEKRDIIRYMWANNQRIVYAQDTGGDENYRAYAVNIDGSNPKDLTPFEKVKTILIDDLKNDPEHMLISLNKRDKRIFDVYRININTGEMKMVAKNPGNIMGWITDHEGKLRVAATTDGVNRSILYREKESDAFNKIITTSFKETLDPLFFTYDNKYMYVASNIGRDKAAIFKYDIAEGKFLDKIYEHPDVDVTSLLSSDKKKKILGVAYFLEKRHYFFFDTERKKLQENLEKRLPGVEVVVYNTSRDETKLLVRTYNDKTMGAYYFYNTTTDELKKLVEISPWLKEEYLANQQPITYKSRDGLTIHGYLTFPKGTVKKNLPVVINPHGGPWARDMWGYNPEVQFLANRGYAVLQMNFRGSTGYGREFWEKSFKEWGKKMQDDITDGVKWLIKEGIADSKRIGIYGGSYGGYATLAGLAFTPDLYSCGVDYVGVSNIFSWLKAVPPYWKPFLEMVYEMVGNPEEDKELLKAASPLFHVDKMKAPLFVAQGANDIRVPKTESDQMVEALKKRGLDVPYMVKDNEGHGFLNEENRFDFYREMEKFLGKHLGGRVEKEKK
jgi:dipeptidyl aminopeptidase/acylaminoacyl peptidase